MVKHASYIELSLSALETNFKFIRKKVGAEVRISSVVKANAYGHSVQKFIPMAEQCGIDHFAVASSSEAEEVLAVCAPSSKIMIMSVLHEEDMPWAIQNSIEFYVFNYTRLVAAAKHAKEVGKKALVHIEVETGGNRTGLHAEAYRKALDFLLKHRDVLEFEGLCTHFGGAENFSNRFKIEKQLANYKAFLSQALELGLKPNYRHAACSAAALAYPETIFDMVRPGVAQYGFWPSPEIEAHHLEATDAPESDTLTQLFSWKTEIMDIREVPEGEFIGYGTSFQASEAMKVAVLPLGYSNGYPRGLSNKGEVLIRGKICKVVGLINMNLFMVDISHLPEAQIGDEVVLVGEQQGNAIPIASFTEADKLLNNEMLSRLPKDIPRVSK